MVLNESLQLVTFKNDGFDEAIRCADDPFDNFCDWLLEISEAHRNDNTAG